MFFLKKQFYTINFASIHVLLTSLSSYLRLFCCYDTCIVYVYVLNWDICTYQGTGMGKLSLFCLFHVYLNNLLETPTPLSHLFNVNTSRQVKDLCIMDLLLLHEKSSAVFKDKLFSSMDDGPDMHMFASGICHLHFIEERTSTSNVDMFEELFP